MSYQSPLAPALLETVTEMVRTDEAYVARLERHYRLFKEALKEEQKKRKLPPRRRGS